MTDIDCVWLCQIPGLPYANPLLGNLLYFMSGEAMETSIEYVVFSCLNMFYALTVVWQVHSQLETLDLTPCTTLFYCSLS